MRQLTSPAQPGAVGELSTIEDNLARWEELAGWEPAVCPPNRRHYFNVLFRVYVY
jgi:hypothetical protein